MEGDNSVSRLRATYEAADQGHVFQFYDLLNDEDKANVVRDAGKFNPAELNERLEAALSALRQTDTHKSQIRAPHKVDLSKLHTLLKGCQSDHHHQQQPSQLPTQLYKNHEQLLEAYRGCVPSSAVCPVVRLMEAPDELRCMWRETGLRLIAEGRVGVVLLAGGDGSRLGFKGVKGAFPVGPVSGSSFFRLFAQRIRRVLYLAATANEKSCSTVGSSSCYGSRSTNGSSASGGHRSPCLPLYIMTSETNRASTEAEFASADYFGLEKENVYFFTQGASPAFDLGGHLMLETPCRLRRAPDGNGGIFAALRSGGVIRDMKARGLVGVQVLAIDNALAKVADPTFYGFTFTSDAEVANKVVSRRSPQESVGVMCEIFTESNCLLPQGQQQQQGRWAGAVIEYSELPKELLERPSQDSSSSRGSFRWANVCMHYFSLRFLDAISAKADLLHGRYHLAKKKIPELRLKEGSPQGSLSPTTWELVTPEEPNGWKLELFIFDVFPLASRVPCLEVDRDEEFAPVKGCNPTQKASISQPEGELDLLDVAADTPEDARVKMSRLHANWLEAATGTRLPYRLEEKGRHVFCEISPLRSYEGEGICKDCLEGIDVNKPIFLN